MAAEAISETGTEATATGGTRRTLYIEPDTGGGSGQNGNTATEPGTRTRRTRNTSGTRRTRATRETARTRAQREALERVEALTQSLQVMTQVGFRLPAYLRSSQWPAPANEHGQPLTRTEPDGSTVQVMAGDYWLLTPDEAEQLAGAWAQVIVLYVPDDAVERSSVIAAALFATFGTLAPRVMTDQYMAKQHRAMAEGEAARAAATVGMNGATEPVTPVEYATNGI